MKSRNLGIVTLLAVFAALLFGLKNKTQYSVGQLRNSKPPEYVSSRHISPGHLSSSDPKVTGPASSVSVLFSDLKPLAEAELERFTRDVRSNVLYMLKWGKLQEGQLDSMKFALWDLSDRGVAHYARELLALRVGKQLSKDESQYFVESLDVIRALAARGHPFSIRALATLARRRVPLNAQGEITDPVASTVTFEAFAALSSVDSRAAQEIVKDMPAHDAVPFVYHYVTGRKLAGMKPELAVQEAKLAFGGTLVSAVGAW